MPLRMDYAMLEPFLDMSISQELKNMWIWTLQSFLHIHYRYSSNQTSISSHVLLHSAQPKLYISLHQVHLGEWCCRLSLIHFLGLQLVDFNGSKWVLICIEKDGNWQAEITEELPPWARVGSTKFFPPVDGRRRLLMGLLAADAKEPWDQRKSIPVRYGTPVSIITIIPAVWEPSPLLPEELGHIQYPIDSWLLVNVT